VGRKGRLRALFLSSLVSSVCFGPSSVNAAKWEQQPLLTGSTGRIQLPFAASSSCTLDPERPGAEPEDCSGGDFEFFEARGRHTLLVRAADGREQTLGFIVDDAPPVVSFAALPRRNGRSGRLRFSVTDQPADAEGHAAGVASVRCSLYSAPIGDGELAPIVPRGDCTEGVFDYAGLDHGPYALVVEAVDRVGNASGPYYVEEFRVGAPRARE
jgi:hypothetical protein